MSIETRDILLKAAEDVQSGMWCKNAWFLNEATGLEVSDTYLFSGHITLDEALQAKRCAQGSIAVAAKQLGGSIDDYRAARNVIEGVVFAKGGGGLILYNDDHLPDDPFEAGQQLAELFRQTAEAL